MNKIIEDAIAVGAVHVIEMPCEYFKITEEELTKFAELQRADAITADNAVINTAPVAWMLKTGHGTAIEINKPECEIDLWKPLYTHPAPVVESEPVEVCPLCDIAECRHIRESAYLKSIGNKPTDWNEVTPPSESARIAELEAKLAECEKDAERYRFIRPSSFSRPLNVVDAGLEPLNDEELDEVIDKALNQIGGE
jgi:hypothetical protein